jgi:hypothetical protein
MRQQFYPLCCFVARKSLLANPSLDAWKHPPARFFLDPVGSSPASALRAGPTSPQEAPRGGRSQAKPLQDQRPWGIAAGKADALPKVVRCCHGNHHSREGPSKHHATSPSG